MRWNKFAKIGEALKNTFTSQTFVGETPCDFVFDVLDKLKIDRGYSLVAVEFGGGIGGEYGLRMIPLNTSFHQLDDNQQEDSYKIWNHITPEHSEMGAWQLPLLSFAVSWMPLYWHARYNFRVYMFSIKDYLSLNNIEFGPKSFDFVRFWDDKRIVPVVAMSGNDVVMRYCYWNSWEGLVLSTVKGYFDTNGHLFFESIGECSDIEKKEILYRYNCGVCY